MSGRTKSIDPRALVSEGAQIGEGVQIGPFAIIDDGAVLEDGCHVAAHAIVRGGVHLGKDVRVHAGAILGEDPQDLSFEGPGGGVRIGERTVIREYATIHRASSPERDTVVGRACMIMVQSHIAHDARLGDQVILCNGALVAGHAEIGDRAFLSGNIVVHQFCRVGRMVMLSGNSGISCDVGPFLTVAGRNEVVGFNKVGMRRGGLDASTQRRVIAAYLSLFRAPTLREGLATVAAGSDLPAAVSEMVAFYGQQGRGFSRPARGRFGTELSEGEAPPTPEA